MENVSDIVGFWLVDEIVCLQCISKAEKEHEITGDDIIYRKDAKKFESFCDRCKRPLIYDS